jgi:hypothetical protein
LNQLSQQIKPKENVEIFKQCIEKVIASRFFQRTLLKVQRFIIRSLIAQKCLRALVSLLFFSLSTQIHFMNYKINFDMCVMKQKCESYEEGIKLFDELTKDAHNWPITQRCAAYWIIRAKFEEKFGHYTNVIDLYALATQFMAKVTFSFSFCILCCGHFSFN